MTKPIVFKYNSQNLLSMIEYCNYPITFDYGKCSPLFSLQDNAVETHYFLKSLHDQEIIVQYRGLSGIDGQCIFVIDRSQISRNRKLQILGL